jgi:AcrR family transcriptional regulator
MAPRDEQDYEQRRLQIIEGALKVFSRKGFEKATNKDIAEAAGIGSPGLIYHYFKDKADLLQQTLEQFSPAMRLFAHPTEFEAVMALPPREALTTLARRFLAMLENRTAVAALKLMLGEATRRPFVAEMIGRLGPGRGLPLITRYLEQQMEAGTMRRMNPEAAARCFIGPLLAYIMTSEILPQPDIQRLGTETMIQTTVEVFLRGMQTNGVDNGVHAAAAHTRDEGV